MLTKLDSAAVVPLSTGILPADHKNRTPETARCGGPL